MGSAMDLFSTVMTLVGGDAASATDGLDLSPRLLGSAPSPRNEMPYYRGGVLYAYRKGPWKLHFITEGAYGLRLPSRSIQCLSCFTCSAIRQSALM